MRLSGPGSSCAAVDGLRPSPTPVACREKRGRKTHSRKPKARSKRCSNSNPGRIVLPRPPPFRQPSNLSISAEYCEKRLRVMFQTPPDKRSETEMKGAIQMIEYLSSFYRSLPSETKRLMARAMGIKTVRAGQILVSHSSPPQSLYIVVNGSVGIYIRTLRVRTLRSGDAFGYGIFNFPGSRAIMDEKGTCLEILSSCLSQPNLSASESGMEILQGGGLIMNKALRSGSLTVYTQSRRSLAGMLNPEPDPALSDGKTRGNVRGSANAGRANNLPVIVPTPRVNNYRLKHLASTLSSKAKAAKAQEELRITPSLRDSQHLASRKSLEHAITQERIKAGGTEHELGPLTAASERARRRALMLKAREERWSIAHASSFFSDNELAFGTHSTVRTDPLDYAPKGAAASSYFCPPSTISGCEAGSPPSSRDQAQQNRLEAMGDDEERAQQQQQQQQQEEEEEGWTSAGLWAATCAPVTVSAPPTCRVRSCSQPRPASTVQRCSREASERDENRFPQRRKTQPPTTSRESNANGDGGSGGRRNRGQLSMRADLRATAEQAGPNLPGLVQNLAVLNGVRLFASEDVFNGLQVREIEREKTPILSDLDSSREARRDVDMECLMAQAAALNERGERDNRYSYRQSDPGPPYFRSDSGRGCTDSGMYFLARNWRTSKDENAPSPIESIQNSIAAITMSVDRLSWSAQKRSRSLTESIAKKSLTGFQNAQLTEG